MKHNPQSLTSSPVLGLLAVSAIAVALSPISPISAMAQQETPDAASATAATAQANPPLRKSDLSAAEVFEQIGQQLDAVESLSCEIHQTVVLSGQKFQAVGRYAQASGNRMRLEYRIFPANAVNAKDAERMALDGTPEDSSEWKVTGSLEQVSDGSVLWSKWVNGPQKELTRRNIREIIEAVKEIPNLSTANSLQSLGIGGLQTLVSQLQVGMDFGEVQEQTVGDTHLLVLAGRWNEQTRKEIFKLPDDPNVTLPEFVPDYVRMYVDASSKLPRRIQYLKKHPDPSVSKVRPVVTLDFRNIHLNDEVPDSTFEFVRGKNDEIKEKDLTAPVIDAIKRIAAQKPEDSEAASTEETDSGK